MHYLVALFVAPVVIFFGAWFIWWLAQEPW
jgi:hypothetical protein